MPRIPPVDRDQVGPFVRSILDAQPQKSNVLETTAHHAATLRGIRTLRESMNDGLSDREHEVIAIEISRHNGCGYCLPAHRRGAELAGLSPEEVDALTRGELLADAELSMVQEFVRGVLKHKGKISDTLFERLTGDGMTHAKMVVVLSEVALYTFFNYLNRLAGTDIEEEIQPYRTDDAAWITEP